MKIETKLPTKNHNVSSESDSQLFLRYVGFFVCIVVILYVFFISLSHIVVFFVSVEDEKKYLTPIGSAFDLTDLPDSLALRYESSEYSIKIADMPETENAFADLGGQVYVTQELLDNIDYFEELDFIIGHELGHIENRDVLKSLVSDIPITILLSIFGGDYGSAIFTALLSNNYSKLTESKSDRYGLDFTYQLNGHVGCALDFFSKKNTLGDNLLEVFSTHPMTDTRIKRAISYAEQMGYEQGECTPLEL